MKKKRILFCTEATFLHTGYSTYCREILNYLYKTGKYEIAEYACYSYDGDIRSSNIPWNFFGASPSPNDSDIVHKQFRSNPIFQFGEYFFPKVCMNFLPDVVCDIRDFWMLEFVERSPYRKMFNWCIMPTVDAEPQAANWMETYQSSDACLSYSQWAGELLKKQSRKINYIGCAPPSANEAYRIIPNKSYLKSKYGIPEGARVIGTVMRNQRRKLYPDLFKSFAKFLSLVNNPEKYFLYCHTSFPDMGWDIPALLQENNISNNVLFTYICSESNKPFCSTFTGARVISPYSKKLTGNFSNVRTGLSYDDLSEIVNLFDLYIQYANSEGFGLPQVEAAACGVPVMSIDYSAMSSVIRKLGGEPLRVKALYKELETGCMRAVPDNDYTVEKMIEFFQFPEEVRKKKGFDCRQAFEKYFRWEESGQMWEKAIDSLPNKNAWSSPLDIKNIPKLPPDISKYSINDQVNFLILNVLQDPSKLNSYLHQKLKQNLIFGHTNDPDSTVYSNDSSFVFNLSPKISAFTIENAYREMKLMRENINSCEQFRKEVLGL